MSDVEIRAAKGAALLDSTFPGWFNQINLGKLVIISTTGCIISQLFGGWGNGTEELSVLSGVNFNDFNGSAEPRKNQEDHGFELTLEEYRSFNPLVYTGDLLTAAWVKEIERRKQA